MKGIEKYKFYFFSLGGKYKTRVHMYMVSARRFTEDLRVISFLLGMVGIRAA